MSEKLYLGKYHKIQRLGKGSFAAVYKVRHAELGYVRAVKVLNEVIDSKEDSNYKRFIKECKMLLTIGNGCHPNIVRVYGPELIDDRAVVEMDCIQGISLDKYVKQNGFVEYSEVRRFIHDIIGALAYTHHDIYTFLMDADEDGVAFDSDGKWEKISPAKEKELIKKYGVAHNDLHSNNVMRRYYDGSYILLDFGLAVQDGECVKSSGRADGATEYLAPEKFDSNEATTRSDVYSVGILLYEMLAGRVPFVLRIDADGKASQKAQNEVFTKHRNEQPEPIIGLRRQAFNKVHPNDTYERDYPKWLDEVIAKCLAKKPEDRYADARELLDDINRHMAAENPAAEEIASLKAEIKKLEEAAKQPQPQQPSPELTSLRNTVARQKVELEGLNKQIADLKAKQQTQSSSAPALKGIVILEDVGHGIKAAYPVYEGRNTYGSRPDSGLHHQIKFNVRGYPFNPVHFSITTRPKGMAFEVEPGVQAYENGGAIQGGVYVRQADEIMLGNKVKINITSI